MIPEGRVTINAIIATMTSGDHDLVEEPVVDDMDVEIWALELVEHVLVLGGRTNTWVRHCSSTTKDL